MLWYVCGPTSARCSDLGESKDLRNHGSSPHSRPMTYLHMAADVLGFIRTLSLSNVSLLGHSITLLKGVAKLAMTLALHPETPADILTKVVVSDIAPVRAKVSEDTVLHIKGMETIEGNGITTRKEADEILEGYEKDPLVRAFLLTNLDTNSRSAALKFKIPIDILKEGRSEIESFPWAPGERSFHGNTLFVKGTKSNFFPEATVTELDTGHWSQ
ncbi:hypothetical protein F5J12DRAFT_809592 [Pisolithus orientalis]|uniref:uncharacterized protein n=1 Tax=Pisolithus orientalis TaxID=936130 RepID=UPI002224E875|nr:uncharacterized protein F5J12DRAFT_809592 [Pisolithus orientalis]KAI6025657.1 hypothetical protein F5J12DRAFT_809592 [Pisolithus orientalis]